MMYSLPSLPQELMGPSPFTGLDARNNFGSEHAVRLHANALFRPRKEGLETKLSYQ